MGRLPDARRCLMCGVAGWTGSSPVWSMSLIRRRREVQPDGSSRIIGSSLAVALCSPCLRAAQRDGRISASRSFLRAV